MIIGLFLDLCFGDPRWLPHPVRAMGWLISQLEAFLRKKFPKTPQGERLAGICLTAGVLLVTGTCAYGILWAAGLIHPILSLAAECIMCYQMLAARGLRDESMKVWKALKETDVEGARTAVSMIVGRDTADLSETGIIKAAVEKVAENTSDGVIAQMCIRDRDAVKNLCRKLAGNGYAKVTVSVGERLSYPDERIVTGNAEDVQDYSFGSLTAVLLEQ